MNKKGEVIKYLALAIIAVLIAFILLSFLFKANIIEIFKNFILKGR